MMIKFITLKIVSAMIYIVLKYIDYVLDVGYCTNIIVLIIKYSSEVFTKCRGIMLTLTAITSA